jgi:hypothetical protein
MTLWSGGGAETASSSATCGTDDLQGALAREHGRLVRVARAERALIAPRVHGARPHAQPPSRFSRSFSGVFSAGGGNAACAIVRGAAARVRRPTDFVDGASPQHELRVASLLAKGEGEPFEPGSL